MKDINKLYCITLFIDIFIITCLYIVSFNLFDLLWIYLVLFSHVLFYYGLYVNNKLILDFIHYFIFILPSLSLFCNHISLKIISLLLIIIIQVLWIKYNKYILNEKVGEFGYDNELNYYLITLTCLLSLQIGYLLK